MSDRPVRQGGTPGGTPGGAPRFSLRGYLGGYLSDHWHGRQPLAWSFWVNLVLLRTAILVLARFAQPTAVADPTTSAIAMLAFFVVFHLAVFAWQIVGVVRAADSYQSGFGTSTLLPLVSYFGIAATVVLTLISAGAGFLQLLQQPQRELAFQILERERASRYHLAPDSQTPSLLRFTGTFELGVTAKLRTLLEQHPEIRGLVLDSPGGQVYEGRGVAKLVQRYGLDTYVLGTCSSACTTAFIAGKTRTLGPDGRLGFHQQWVEPDFPVYLVDQKEEMKKDLAYFKSRGVAPDFLDKIFATPHDQLWFPTAEELIAAGVVHRIGGLPD